MKAAREELYFDENLGQIGPQMAEMWWPGPPGTQTKFRPIAFAIAETKQHNDEALQWRN